MSDSGKNPTQIGDYFIPDLCRGQGLLGLSAIAALSAVLIALLHSGIGDFDFLWLGKTPDGNPLLHFFPFFRRQGRLGEIRHHESG